MGRYLDIIGERWVLSASYVLMALCFVGYAVVNNPYVLGAFLIGIYLLVTLSIGLSTYVNRIAPPAEHTATLSMGVAFNHVASVTMPFLGGILWATLGYRWAFLVGIPAAVASIAIVQRLPGGRSEAQAVGGVPTSPSQR